MKTLFTCNRIVKSEDTNIESVLKTCFFLDDVMQWETGEDNLFETKKHTTHVDIRGGHALYIDMTFDKFTNIMQHFLNRQGDIILQMKQN